MTKTEAIDLLDNLIGFVEDSHDNDYDTALNMAIEALESQERQELIVGSYLIEEPGCSEKPNRSDTIYRQDAIDVAKQHWYKPDIAKALEELPSAQPEQRYTKKELEIFKHGISLSLLSKRSSQHWHYDEDTATEIKFLERLYEKVSANMRGGQNE